MIHWGVLGVGSIAHRFIESLRHSTTGELVALASRNPETTNRYPGVVVHPTYEGLLTDPTVDIVYIASPHMTHYEWIIKALEHKKHVLCEKPATLKASQIDEIHELATSQQCFFMEAFKTKFTPALKHLQDTLQGEEILKIEAQFCFNVPKEHARYLYDPQQGGALYDVNTYLAGFAQCFVKGADLTSRQVTWQDGVDVEFAYTLKADETLINLRGSIIEQRERDAWIETTHYRIHIPNFHRPTEYTINDQVVNIPLEGDDFSGEIEEAHRCILTKRIESEIHSHQDTKDLILLTETLRQQ